MDSYNEAMLLEGMFLPLTTPFTPDGRLNARKLEENVRRYSKTPAAGLAVLSRTGQPTLLSDAETREAMRVVAQAAAVEKVLLVGVARDSVAGTLELIEFAAEAGYDAALVPVPSVLRGGLETLELQTFYRAVADRAALPVVLDGEVAVSNVVELASHPKIIGLVDPCGNAATLREIVAGTASVRREVTVTTVFAAVTGRMVKKQGAKDAMFVSAGTLSGGGTAMSAAATGARGLKTRTKAVGFQVLCGSTAGMLEALQAGAAGVMPPLAASAPQVCYEVLAAWKDGDPALAAEKQERLCLLANSIEAEMGVSGLVAGVKYGCDLNGYFGGRPRLPMLPLKADERERIGRLMLETKN